jgi:hypothetical protein
MFYRIFHYNPERWPERLARKKEETGGNFIITSFLINVTEMVTPHLKKSATIMLIADFFKFILAV